MANKKIIVAISSLVVIVIVVLLFFLLSSSEDSVLSGKKVTDQNLLKGDWVRTDASYLLTNISSLGWKNGNDAVAVNPNPINVETANWEQNYGDLKLSIILRDVNYPGSRYTLNYLKDRDMLAGEYFQAVEGLTFYVEFARYKAGLRRN